MPQKPARLAEILKAAGVESQLELLLLNRLERAGLPTGEAQQRIIPGRKFAFDRVWYSAGVAVEVQGATFVKGRHSTGTGIASGCEKMSLAAAHGWRVLPVTKHQIEDGSAVRWIAAALGLSESGVSSK